MARLDFLVLFAGSIFAVAFDLSGIFLLTGFESMSRIAGSSSRSFPAFFLLPSIVAQVGTRVLSVVGSGRWRKNRFLIEPRGDFASVVEFRVVFFLCVRCRFPASNFLLCAVWGSDL